MRRNVYSENFKKKIVEQSNMCPSINLLAEEYNISIWNIYNWRRDIRYNRRLKRYRGITVYPGNDNYEKIDKAIMLLKEILETLDND